MSDNLNQEAADSTVGAADSTTVEVGITGQNLAPNERTPINEAPKDAYSYGLFKRHMRFDPVTIVFAILVFAGGIYGYLSKNSAASLISATIFAALLAATTFLEGARKNPYPLLVVLFSLGSMMGYMAISKEKFMPSGLVATFAFVLFARHVYLVYLRRREASHST